METKELKIAIPEGYEIDTERSTFEKIVFKKIEKTLPKTWKEFCETHPIQEGEAYIDTGSCTTCYTISGSRRDKQQDKNILPNKETAEAMLALCQLIQLRDAYNDGWTPNLNDLTEYKYAIRNCSNKITGINTFVSEVLSFKTKELRDQFLENFRDLIEVAKPLI